MKKFMIMLMALCLCGFTSGIVQAEETAPAKEGCQVEATADSVHGNIVDAIKCGGKCKGKCCSKCDCPKCNCQKCSCPDKCKCDCPKCDCCKKKCKCSEAKADSMHGNIVDAVQGKSDKTKCKCKKGCKCKSEK